MQGPGQGGALCLSLRQTLIGQGGALCLSRQHTLALGGGAPRWPPTTAANTSPSIERFQ
eukprot:CAMPEP_0114178070 /NCGR_PEP_ID=MMETSP0043_2-20121206/38353_1 /TAXON_ID=464988 /ORGANISM="Hemiselmis andersenii, Strain CCMP644" /LENGTH=58 /DNA_ID=CAMNT_0001276469 /DNA_START=155 /DNA_END=331 /DNA_ORIENTATION=-